MHGAYGDYVKVAVSDEVMEKVAKSLGGFVESRFLFGGVGVVLPFFCVPGFCPHSLLGVVLWVAGVGKREFLEEAEEKEVKSSDF